MQNFIFSKGLLNQLSQLEVNRGSKLKSNRSLTVWIGSILYVLQIGLVISLPQNQINPDYAHP